MKQTLINYIDDNQEEIYELGDELFVNPELGYKEWKTREILINYFQNHGIKVENQFALTGFSVSLGSGRPHIGLIAELDAIPTLGHPCENKNDHAAHACGHSSQCTIMASAFTALKQIEDKLPGKVTLYFTPAEEFTDLTFRKGLIAKGKIKYAGGKQQMIYEHVFDEADCFIHLHAAVYPDHRFSLGSSLAGFIHKEITFKGQGAHAAMCPDLGKNALNMCTLYLNAVNMLRETFREDDLVRVHGIIDKGGDTVNSIPEEVIYECYVRSDNPEYLVKLNNQLTETAKHCAAALQGEAIVKDTLGYLPLKQSKELNDVIHDSMLDYCDEEDILYGERSTAAGDVGDVSCLKPVIQYGYTGFKGRIHGSDFEIVDKNEVYLTQAKIVVSSVLDLLQHPEKVDNIVNSFKPKMTYQQYIDYLNN